MLKPRTVFKFLLRNSILESHLNMYYSSGIDEARLFQNWLMNNTLDIYVLLYNNHLCEVFVVSKLPFLFFFTNVPLVFTPIYLVGDL